MNEKLEKELKVLEDELRKCEQELLLLNKRRGYLTQKIIENSGAIKSIKKMLKSDSVTKEIKENVPKN